MTEAFCNTLKKFGSNIQPNQAINAETVALDETAVDRWLETKLAEQPDGWVQYSDQNVWYRAGKPVSITVADEQERPWTERDRIEGVPFAAELVVGKLSHHLRLGASGWLGSTLSRLERTGCAIETRRFIRSTAPRLRHITYEVSWTGTPLRPTAFRLVINPNDRS